MAKMEKWRCRRAGGLAVGDTLCLTPKWEWELDRARLRWADGGSLV